MLKSPVYTNQKRIEILNKEIQTQYADLDYKYKKLEEKYKAKLSESYFEKVLGGFGVIFTIITIVIAILTLGLPVLLYFLGIKPFQDAVKKFEKKFVKLEKNFYKRFEEFLVSSREKQVKNAFNDLRSSDNKKRARALSFFTLTQYEDFSKENFFTMYQFCKNENTDFNTKQLFTSLLLVNESMFAKELLTNIEYAKEFKAIILNHIARNGFENNFGYIEAILKGSDDQYNDLRIMSSRFENAIKFLIYKPLIALLTKETKEKIKSDHFLMIFNDDLSRQEVKRNH